SHPFLWHHSLVVVRTTSRSIDTITTIGIEPYGHRGYRGQSRGTSEPHERMYDLHGSIAVVDEGFRWPIENRDSEGALFGGFWPERHVGRGLYQGMEFLHVNARTIINTVPASSRMLFKYTINAYRGCSHACTYCFARPTHEFLGLGIGEDFERKIVVKVNA